MKNYETREKREMKTEAILTDYVTGRTVADIGAEANRQATERLLVETKGYKKEEIEVDAPIAVDIDGAIYRSRVDLVIRVEGRRLMVIKCAAGSLDSRQREILAAARLLETRPVPLAAASDGRSAIVWDVHTGKALAEGHDAIPDRPTLIERCQDNDRPTLDESRRRREKIIFRSYDTMNVNVRRDPDATT